MIQINILATASSYIPAPPSGDESGFENVEYTYIILTENIGSSWMFDWDDGSYSEWIKLGESEDSISQTHIWSLDGIYEVKVKRNDIYQGESPWSDPLIVTMPKNKPINILFFRFLENHPHLFPLLRQLLKL